jgi:hypothetical protein
MPCPLLKPQPPSTPTMDPHIISALSSLHTRLTRLENSNHLAGKEIHPDKETYQMQSLEILQRFIKELNLRRRSEGLPVLHISNPFMTENVHIKYEIKGPVILTYSTSNAAKRFDIICIFSTEMDDPIKYKIRFTLKPQYRSEDTFKSRGSPEYETIDCRNEQQVVETLLSMYYP